MTTADGGTLRLIAGTVIILGAAITAVVWVGRQVRGQLGPGAKKPAPSLDRFDAIPPALVKQALERGLVTATQLATMTPIERRFVLEAVRKQIEGDAPDGSAVPDDATAGAASPAASTTLASPPPPRPSVTQPPSPSDASLIPDRERLSVWCPLCGTALKLPAFPPMVAFCASCGARTAVRDDSGAGRYVINVAAAAGTEPPRVQ